MKGKTVKRKDHFSVNRLCHKTFLFPVWWHLFGVKVSRALSVEAIPWEQCPDRADTLLDQTPRCRHTVLKQGIFSPAPHTHDDSVGKAHRHVTARHFIHSEFDLDLGVICFTPHPSTARFNQQKCRTVGPSLEAFCFLMKLETGFIRGFCSPTTYCYISFGHLSFQPRVMSCVHSHTVREVSGARVAKLNTIAQFLYFMVIKKTDESPEDWVFKGRACITKFLQRQ